MDCLFFQLAPQRLTTLGHIKVLINHDLINTINYCDGMFICVCGICNCHVSPEANALSRMGAVRFHLGLMDIIAGKVSVGYLLGRSLKVSVGYFFGDLSLVYWSR